ncbi:DNA-directed RNA polymerase sigma-70 factor [Geothrix limicola]|uniref:DNA-directed RNA polymerase sigma-70 factor n=1 Tax=Geothrix limicola TaxID=2927978 RepID=A0ABQ5QGJ3_9BACT|nr:DUF6596 domain-containing protein [Geothrix limicola]GLH73466.1 DNA-directed RNA polymerase sigma-70 factor [Geothrix limicola]
MTQREDEAHRALETAARQSYGKLIACLAAGTRDIALAEDALSEAFAAALAAWTDQGCPARPEGWLLTVARRKMIDQYRGRRRDELAAEQWRILVEDAATETAEADLPDRRLALMFACAHPAIEASVRAPLMLQTVVGLDAKQIASGFLMSPSAMGKRLVRAKEKIRRAAIPFRIPERTELPARLDAVLEAIYAAFTEGWSDPAGTDAQRRGLTEEALFLARVAVDLLPKEPEALGLLALLLHLEARRRARRDGQGDYVPFADQDTALWDAPMIAEAEAVLQRAGAMGAPGRYQLEAALQSAHVHRRLRGGAPWAEVLRLYDALFAITGSPVVAINRAMALAELEGPTRALEALSEVAADARLVEYQPYWAVRADLLARAGERAEARHAYEVAIGLQRDPAVRRFLQGRLSSLQEDS